MSLGREERTLQAEGDLGLRSQRQESKVQNLGGAGRLLEEAFQTREELGRGCQVSRFLELKSQISGFCSKNAHLSIVAGLRVTLSWEPWWRPRGRGGRLNSSTWVATPTRFGKESLASSTERP